MFSIGIAKMKMSDGAYTNDTCRFWLKKAFRALVLLVTLYNISIMETQAQDLQRGQIINLPPSEFKNQFTNTDNAILIDVRSRFEFRVYGHIEGAVNTGLTRRLNKFAERTDSDTIVFVCCLSGHRSITACDNLIKKGFISVYNLDGGLLAWKKEGLLLNK